MEKETLVLNEEDLDSLNKFGETWYFGEDNYSTDIINSLFRYGFCLVQVSLCVATKMVKNNNVTEVPWTSDIGYSPPIISAILETLGLPFDNRNLRLELHSITSARNFCAHAMHHDPCHTIIPEPTSTVAGDVYHQYCMDNQCDLARANQLLLLHIQSKVDQRESRVLRARAEVVQEQERQKQMEEERKKKRARMKECASQTEYPSQKECSSQTEEPNQKDDECSNDVSNIMEAFDYNNLTYYEISVIYSILFTLMIIVYNIVMDLYFAIF